MSKASTYRTAALFSEVWQKRKRTSLRDLAKANLADISRVLGRREGEEEEGRLGVLGWRVWKLAPFAAECTVSR